LPILSELKFNDQLVTISTIGRFQRIKGQTLLLDALYELSKQKNTLYILYIIGDVNGENPDDLIYKKELQVKADIYRSHFLDIRFEGFQDNVSSYIAMSDFIVIPSLYESFSMVAIEALALGKPIIAPNAGGPKDIINSDDIGILFKPNSAADLCAAIKRMIVNRSFFTKEKCIARAKNFSIDIQAQKHLFIYQDVLKEANS
jgi:glycosyltransferase involved in cell wall biosynthesis